MDRNTVKPGMLIKWTARKDGRYSPYGPLINLFPTRSLDSVTLKSLDSRPTPAKTTTEDDLFVFLGVHPNIAGSWKLYSYRLNENVWVFNKAFWKGCELISDAASTTDTPQDI